MAELCVKGKPPIVGVAAVRAGSGLAAVLLLIATISFANAALATVWSTPDGE